MHQFIFSWTGRSFDYTRNIISLALKVNGILIIRALLAHRKLVLPKWIGKGQDELMEAVILKIRLLPFRIKSIFINYKNIKSTILSPELLSLPYTFNCVPHLSLWIGYIYWEDAQCIFFKNQEKIRSMVFKYECLMAPSIVRFYYTVKPKI